MSDLRVLISGCSIAGPVAAYFLSKAGAQVTVVERAPSLRLAGQSVDLRGNGVKIIQRMGLEKAIRERVTNEDGIKFVDADDKVVAEFPAGDGTDSSWEFSADIEILRGQLAQALYEATKNSAEYLFGDWVTKIDEQSDCVRVGFNNDTPSREFDLVIVADGQNSSTRDLAFDGKLPGELKSLDQWIVWFGISDLKHDDRSWRWYNAPGGRMVSMRPSDTDTRGNLAIIGHGDEMKSVLGAPVPEQKRLWRKLFADVGWKTDRALQGMDEADDFYMQEVLQVNLDQWSRGRVVLVGDAAYAPIPISGMGTTCAVVGAYTLAGEIARNPNHLSKAFEAYESKIRPLIDRAQSLPPGVPQIANPQTELGISIFKGVLKFQALPGVFKFFKALGLGNPPANSIDLEDYEF